MLEAVARARLDALVDRVADVLLAGSARWQDVTRYVMRCQLTQETRVDKALDDVAGNIYRGGYVLLKFGVFKLQLASGVIA